MAYIPALKYHFLTPIYDWFIAFTMPEVEAKKRVIALAMLENGDKILDFGCGTGTLCRMLKEEYPETDLIGLDVDDAILGIAKEKRNKENLDFELQCFEGNKIPFPNGHFDKILSTWVFHHLPMIQKIEAFKEIKRVLKPNGLFVLADWGKAQKWLMRLLFFILQVFDNFKTTNDNVKGRIPYFLEKAGFSESLINERRSTVFGTLEYWVLKTD